MYAVHSEYSGFLSHSMTIQSSLEWETAACEHKGSSGATRLKYLDKRPRSNSEPASTTHFCTCLSPLSRKIKKSNLQKDLGIWISQLAVQKESLCTYRAWNLPHMFTFTFTRNLSKLCNRDRGRERENVISTTALSFLKSQASLCTPESGANSHVGHTSWGWQAANCFFSWHLMNHESLYIFANTMCVLNTFCVHYFRSFLQGILKSGRNGRWKVLRTTRAWSMATTPIGRKSWSMGQGGQRSGLTWPQHASWWLIFVTKRKRTSWTVRKDSELWNEPGNEVNVEHVTLATGVK